MPIFMKEVFAFVAYVVGIYQKDGLGGGRDGWIDDVMLSLFLTTRIDT